MLNAKKYIRIEILLWIIVLLLIMLGCTILWKNSQKEYETHKIFMSDIDGLIVGSPVKLMGVQVGYISDIKIVNNNVYIKFIIKDKNIHLPWGTKATVEFSGMAGSRSLELYPPDKVADGENVDYIEVIEPTRLSKSLHMLSDMYNKFMDICFGLAAFNANISDIDLNVEENENNIQFKNLLEFADEWLDNSNNKVTEIGKKLRKDK